MIDKDDFPELEHSPLSGKVSEDGITVEVFIFRIADCGAPWILEVEDEEGRSILWDEYFPTDQDAYRAFYSVLKSNGIHSFVPKH